MSKQVIKIQLNSKSIGTKPLIINDTLTTIREKIRDRIDKPYLFLDKEGNIIKTEDEGNLKLENIVKEKKINIIEDESQMKIILNDSELCFMKYTPSQKLNEIRNIIMNKINDDFTFLDIDGFEVMKKDECDYEVDDIINDKSLKLKSLKPSNPTQNKNNNLMKPQINKKIRNINLSKYEIIEKKEDLTIYKYSNLQRKSDHKLVYQYFYDPYEIRDFQDAYVVLFCGKTGDGKTTAINAFFNIIKGVTLVDNYRFILISEPEKEKGQAESQTDGVHIYYIRDYDNKPVILIDSQGYGDTRGKQYDELIDKAFQYVFSHVIEHINAVGFIVKSNTNRIDILTKYIFSSVTSLFSEDISENFIILATFANKSTMEKGPDFVSSIKTDADFLKIEERMDSNWWYAFDGKNILDNEKDKLTVYSFSKASEYYEQKVKKLRKKAIKKCAEVLNTRMELKVEVENLTDNFYKLVVEQGNLIKKENIINSNANKIEEMELKINQLKYNMESLNPKQLEEKILNLNNEFNKMMNYLSNQTIYQTVNKLRPSDNLYTHCDVCEKNCHANCDCFFSSLGRCKIYSIWEKKCEECGCNKDKHKQDKYSYNFITIEIKKDTEKEKEKERDKKKIEENKIKEEIKKKKGVKDKIIRQKENLENNKELLQKEKSKNILEKREIQKKINEINHKILITILKMQSLNEKVNNIAMNNNHIKNEDEYIDDLLDKMDKMNIKDKTQIEKIQKIKETNKIIKQALSLDKISLETMDESQISEKLQMMIPDRIF